MNGLTFGTIHSYTNLNLILSEVDIPPATPKTTFVEIEGGNGSLDLTEALGEVKFQDREATLTFSVLPSDDFEEKKTQVSNLVNGQKFNITLDKDPDYYYTGRCSVDEYSSDKMIRKIVISATLAPYKYKQNVTVVTVQSGTVTQALNNDRMTVVPTITTTAQTVITFDGDDYTLSAGTHKVLNIQFVEGDNTVTVLSTGTTTFTYQEGAL